jgi:hypothetical protein
MALLEGIHCSSLLLHMVTFAGGSPALSISLTLNAGLFFK